MQALQLTQQANLLAARAELRFLDAEQAVQHADTAKSALLQASRPSAERIDVPAVDRHRVVSLVAVQVTAELYRRMHAHAAAEGVRVAWRCCNGCFGAGCSRRPLIPAAPLAPRRQGAAGPGNVGSGTRSRNANRIFGIIPGHHSAMPSASDPRFAACRALWRRAGAAGCEPTGLPRRPAGTPGRGRRRGGTLPHPTQAFAGSAPCTTVGPKGVACMWKAYGRLKAPQRTPSTCCRPGRGCPGFVRAGGPGPYGSCLREGGAEPGGQGGGASGAGEFGTGRYRCTCICSNAE